MDIIAIAPAPQPNTSSSNGGMDGAETPESGFGLFFNEAVAATAKHGQSSRQSSQKSTPHQEVKQSAEKHPDLIASAHGAEDGQTLQAIESFLAGLTPEQLFALASSPDIGQGLRTLLLSRFTEQTGQQPSAWFATGQQGFPASSQMPPVTALSGAVVALNAPDSNLLTFNLEPGSALPVNQNNGPTTAALLAQLQNLIHRNNDQVQITASFQQNQRVESPGYLSGPLVLGVADAAATTASPVAATAEMTFRPTAEPALVPLRQELNGSDAVPRVTVLQQQVHEQKSESGGQQQTSQHQAGASPQSSTTIGQPVSDQSTAATVFSAQFQETSQAMESGRTGNTQTLPHHLTQAQENDVLHQIVQRFSIQTHLQNSRLSLRLHPAELGALKIDVTVKDDALKAHIYAQTRQAQEVIEKHLPRLKAILEEHGMQVDDLLVTFSSDSLDSFSNQTGNSLAEQMADFPSQKKPRGGDLFTTSLEEPLHETGTEQPAGVNLTV